MTFAEARLINRAMRAIKAVLHVKLLKPEYREANKTNPLYGYCYIATEALYYMCAGACGFEPKRARDDNGVVHWWLENRQTPGLRIDVTSGQYTRAGRLPPYSRGVFGGFLTKQPSKRAQEVMRLAYAKIRKDTE